MKRTRLLALTATVGIGLTACSSGESDVEAAAGGEGGELQTVDVGYVQLPIFAPLYVADASGTAS
jgi:NitT/TauT family transport system substrate-binding protein